ncbi:TrkA-N domain-containing protein [Streptomyces sp. cf386]|nr:TrkA-N domain-containing protein [Streptomyces sp. cf386]
MVVCGDDGLAHRLAVELDAVCGEAVTVVLPSRRDEYGAVIAALHRDPRSPVELLVTKRPDEQTLRAAGVERAAALALTYADDRTNMTAALLARSLNPSVRLVVRMFNRERGRHLELLLDRAARAGGIDDDSLLDMSTTVLSDADTAVPELVAAAAVGHGHTLQIEGKVFRGVVRPAGAPPRPTDLIALAVLSGAHQDDPAGDDSAETPGEDGTQLLPDTVTVDRRQFTHGRLVLEEVTHHHTPVPAARGTSGSSVRRAWLRRRIAHLPWKVFLAREVMAVFGALAAIVAFLALFTWLFAHPDPWWKSLYLPLLDIFTMGDPATEEGAVRRWLQLIAGLVGLAVLPLVVAAAVNATEAFRSASVNHPPAGDLSDHIVIVGLGKIGSRVLAQLCTTDHKVVAVERDPAARAVTLARELGVPLLLEDAATPGVLDQARIRHSRSLLVLTHDDGENLDIVMAAREANPGVRVVMRLYDDDFAATVQRTLRASYPSALTRSRSVSALAAPSFVAAMMGRHVLGVMPVERGSLLFTCVDVAGHPELEGRSVHAAFRKNEWRVLAVGTAVASPASAATDTLAGLRRDGHPGRPPPRRTHRVRLAPGPGAGATGGGPGGAGDHAARPGHTDRRCAAAPGRPVQLTTPGRRP